MFKFLLTVTLQVWTSSILIGGLGDFKFGFIEEGGCWGISKITGGTLSWHRWKITGGMYVIPHIEFQCTQWFWNSLNSLNCSGFFLVLVMYLKKSFFRLVLELLLNSDFFTINFLGYIIWGCPLFGSPTCDKTFQFCPTQP